MPFVVGGGATPKEIWEYSERTLTQTKFGFWSAIITQQQGSVSVAADSTSYIDIQPPSGETWLVELAFSWTAWDGNFVSLYYDYDGSTARLHVAGRGAGDNLGELILTRVLTNTLYARIAARNRLTSAYNFYYGYSGFKLSKPLYSPKRLTGQSSPPWKRKPTAFKIPAEVEALADYIADIYDDDRREYRQAIILEENTPLAVDPRTSFPVERLTAICYVDDFINNILKRLKLGQLDLERSGWKKYFEKWRSEGIKVL